MLQTWLTKSISLKLRNIRSGTSSVPKPSWVMTSSTTRCWYGVRAGVSNPLEQLLDVVVAPLAIVLAVGPVDRLDIVLEALDLVRVLRQEVVGGILVGKVPLEALISERLALEHRTGQRDVAVAAPEERSVSQHAEVDIDRAHEADDRLVVHGPVVDIAPASA